MGDRVDDRPVHEDVRCLWIRKAFGVRGVLEGQSIGDPGCRREVLGNGAGHTTRQIDRLRSLGRDPVRADVVNRPCVDGPASQLGRRRNVGPEGPDRDRRLESAVDDEFGVFRIRNVGDHCLEVDAVRAAAVGVGDGQRVQAGVECRRDVRCVMPHLLEVRLINARRGLWLPPDFDPVECRDGAVVRHQVDRDGRARIGWRQNEGNGVDSGLGRYINNARGIVDRASPRRVDPPCSSDWRCIGRTPAAQ